MASRPRTDWLEDGRNMQLVKPVEFVCSQGIHWIAPSGAIVNGASIPWFFRRVVGCPYCGKYRDASIIHDFYCDVKVYPSTEVHRMFYEKMRLDGVGRIQAAIMYAAVRVFGPKFG